MCKPKYYITTAIAYTSRKPHIGNSYEIVMTDAMARYKRLQGYDVFFLTGTDEHGQKIEEYAKNAGVSPKDYVDKVSAEIKEICNLLNISYNHFIRTTDDYHVESVQKIFKALYDKGYIYKGKYSGKYCTPCESFWTESQLYRKSLKNSMNKGISIKGLMRVFTVHRAKVSGHSHSLKTANVPTVAGK